MSWLITILALSPLFSWAQGTTPDKTVAAWNATTDEKTQALADKGNAAAGAQAYIVCTGCHRPDGGGRLNGSYPRLAGQHASVLIKQMTDIHSGHRINPKMQPFIADETPQDIADIAVYLQGLPVSTQNGIGDGNNLRIGADLYAKDCATCHGKVGQGSAAKFYPKLSGQHYNYLLREMHMIWSGDRGNSNPEMVKIIKPYKDAEMEAVADYISRISQTN